MVTFCLSLCLIGCGGPQGSHRAAATACGRCCRRHNSSQESTGAFIAASLRHPCTHMHAHTRTQTHTRTHTHHVTATGSDVTECRLHSPDGQVAGGSGSQGDVIILISPLLPPSFSFSFSFIPFIHSTILQSTCSSSYLSTQSFPHPTTHPSNYSTSHFLHPPIHLTTQTPSQFIHPIHPSISSIHQPPPSINHPHPSTIHSSILPHPSIAYPSIQSLIHHPSILPISGGSLRQQSTGAVGDEGTELHPTHQEQPPRRQLRHRSTAGGCCGWWWRW